MLKQYNKLSSPILIFLSLIMAATGGFFYGKYTQAPNINSEPETTIPYINKQLGFSINYPSWVNNIQENSEMVNFTTLPSYVGELPNDGYAVLTEKTNFTSIEDWLEEQPKGSAKSEGYEPVLWLFYNRTALVAKYFMTEQDEKRQPIYAKKLEAVHVNNGILYTIKYKNYFQPNQTSELNQETFDFISSFQTLQEPMFSSREECDKYLKNKPVGTTCLSGPKN